MRVSSLPQVVASARQFLSISLLVVGFKLIARLLRQPPKLSLPWWRLLLFADEEVLCLSKCIFDWPHISKLLTMMPTCVMCVLLGDAYCVDLMWLN